jgi:NADH-quinone oxidoreductase subunit K
MISSSFYLILSATLFTIGVVGVLTRRNAVVVLMCIELMLNSANLTFVAFSRYLASMTGQVFVLMAVAVAAAEVAVGLGLIIALYRQKTTVDVDDINILKW